ncbi:MAG: hypothetical protein DCC58_17565 [Chloroflexi bacterium]|nr:MAG: hypothetical protein DCC58_17565 [Chloroflexota bacterium]
MQTTQRFTGWMKQALHDHWLPLLWLVAPVGFVVWSTGLDSTPLLFVLPVATFLIGFTLRPRHVWLIWLGAVVIQWAAMGIFGKYTEPGDETAFSLVVEAFFWMAIGVLVPVFLGRLLAQVVKKDGRRADQPRATHA